MTKCCGYGIQNDPEDSIISSTLRGHDEAAWLQFIG
jgi:hypothetical protein